ncbi:MAG: ABC transporter ATP-binding protein [Candidatus Bathyarchaeota archaeon]|nr:ABC transporter ATP-binding protein [Candidatus Bathyarchaeota archaeon]
MNPILETKNLHKQFGGLTAVDNFSLQIKEGEILGLIGPNGAGKTTFFNLITGFLKPDSGIVLLKGKNITKLKPHKIANLGMVRTFQIIKPFKQMLAVENVAVACLSDRAKRKRNGDDILSKTLKSLRQVEIIPPAENMFKLASELSHGYTKRLDIARALALEPEIILLDEPFGGLGLKETPIMNSLIKRLNEQGLTIIIIEHKMRELMKLAHRIAVMHFGEKIAEGTPKEISKNQRVCQAYLGKEGDELFV